MLLLTMNPHCQLGTSQHHISHGRRIALRIPTTKAGDETTRPKEGSCMSFFPLGEAGAAYVFQNDNATMGDFSKNMGKQIPWKSIAKAMKNPWKPTWTWILREAKIWEKSWKFICSLRNDIWKNHADFPYKNVSLLGIPHPCLCEIFMKLMSCPELEASEIRWVNNPTAGFIWILDVIQYNPENLRTINQEIWINPIQINETAGWVNPIQEI